MCSGQQRRFPSFLDRHTPDGINTVLLDQVFPAPPPPTRADVNLSSFADYLPLSQEEISGALAKCSSSAAPGCDSIFYDFWRKIH